MKAPVRMKAEDERLRMRMRDGTKKLFGVVRVAIDVC
jgi:hypothetical protein